MKVAVDTNAYASLEEGNAVYVDIIQRAELLGFSTIVLGELRAGFHAGTRPMQNEKNLTRVIAANRVEVLDITETTTHFFAKIWSDLRKKGRPIPTNDIWIAALCLERGFALLTRDTRFSYVSGLSMLP